MQSKICDVSKLSSKTQFSVIQAKKNKNVTIVWPCRYDSAVSKVSKAVPIFLVHSPCVASKRQLVDVHPKVLVTELDWDMRHLVDSLHRGGS